MNINLIGIGLGNPNLLTKAAYPAISNSNIIIGAKILKNINYSIIHPSQSLPSLLVPLTPPISARAARTPRSFSQSLRDSLVNLN